MIRCDICNTTANHPNNNGCDEDLEGWIITVEDDICEECVNKIKSGELQVKDYDFNLEEKVIEYMICRR